MKVALVDKHSCNEQLYLSPSPAFSSFLNILKITPKVDYVAETRAASLWSVLPQILARWPSGVACFSKRQTLIRTEFHVLDAVDLPVG